MTEQKTSTTTHEYPVGGHNNWEDAYSAQVYASFWELADYAEAYWFGPLADLNIPIWAEYDADDEQEYGFPTIQIGVFTPRHGHCHQAIAPCSPEQNQEVRTWLMRVWAGRADGQFGRRIAG